ncbi:MAG TPA: class D sortase [Steroidobacteraceae bacterium]|jgi:sortase A
MNTTQDVAGSTAWRKFERLLWIAGLGLLLAYGALRLWSHQQQEAGLEQFATLRATQQAASTAPSPPAPVTAGPVGGTLLVTPEPDRTLWSAQRIRAYAVASTATAPLGVLRIPSIKLAVPIYEGTGETTLDRGAGRIAGTAQLDAAGNIGIAAHRDGFFRGLKDLRVGEEMMLQTIAGDRRYRVTKLLITSPTDVSVIAPTATPAITLVTCYPFYFVGSAPQRYIVRAEPIAP